MKKILLITVIAAAALLSCKKESAGPPVTRLSSGTVYPVEWLKIIATCTNNCQKRFTDDAYLIGVVLADEVYGNFYKEVYLRDRTGKGAIRIDFLSSKSGYFVGDSIRVNLKGLDVGINENTGMPEIDSVDYEKSVVKFGSGPRPEPIQITLSQLGGSQTYTNYLCDLVTINGVAFIPADTAKVWADVVGQAALNRIIQDCVGNQITVRTDDQSSFATQKTPKGFGSITGIATAYLGTNQLVIRHPADVNMNGTGCATYLKKDFNDQSLTQGGWTQQSVQNPSAVWTATTYGGVYFAKISGYIGGTNTNSENWLISPAINLSNAVKPQLSFKTAINFSGPAPEVYVSTNYTSGLPNTAAWTQLTGFAVSGGGYVWTSSGALSLSNFKTANVRIAFKYRSTTSGAATLELDDIYVFD